MLVAQSVAAHGDDGREGDLEALVRRRYAGEEPGDFAAVGEAEDEFVDDVGGADGAGEEGKGCVCGVGEDEMVRVEGC